MQETRSVTEITFKCPKFDIRALGRSRAKCAPARRSSIHSISPCGASFSGQLSPSGPVYKKVNSVPLSSMALARTSFTPPNTAVHSPWSDALEKLNHHHSFEHNYEDKVCKIKMNYRSLLDQLSDESRPKPWAAVKIIDFAHAFFNEEDERAIDDNFKEGIDNFVAIFEAFLKETDNQVF